MRSFLSRVAAGRTDRRVFCIDLFTCARDVRGDPKVEEFRDVVRRAVAALDRPGLVYLSGRSLLPSATGLTADEVHPSATGMAHIATRLARHMGRRRAQTAEGQAHAVL